VSRIIYLGIGIVFMMLSDPVLADNCRSDPAPPKCEHYPATFDAAAEAQANIIWSSQSRMSGDLLEAILKKCGFGLRGKTGHFLSASEALTT
jgi:hypothetical protein